jgi:hypothetical protein
MVKSFFSVSSSKFKFAVRVAQQMSTMASSHRLGPTYCHETFVANEDDQHNGVTTIFRNLQRKALETNTDF